MRPIKLRVNNIASLKGQHLVDFEALSEKSSLFAITGETGAGKSTLLNCMAMALFGKVYKSNINQFDLVTTGEREGSIEFIFQSGGITYLATWKAKILKQNGEHYSTPQPPIRELYQTNSFEFNGKLTILKKTPSQVLNLSFDQFCKCIILNQGEFARFLLAGFNERKEILEKLYPGEIFDQLSIQLRKEKESLEKQINNFEIEAHTLKTSQDSDINAREIWTTKNSQLQIVKEVFKSLEKKHYQFKTLLSYHQRYHETERRLSQTESFLEQDLANLNQSLREIEKTSEEYAYAKEVLETKSELLKELIKKKNQLSQLIDLRTLNESNLTKKRQELDWVQQMLQKKQSDFSRWMLEKQHKINELMVSPDKLKKWASSLPDLMKDLTSIDELTTELNSSKKKFTSLINQGEELSIKQQKTIILSDEIKQWFSEIEHELSSTPHSAQKDFLQKLKEFLSTKISAQSSNDLDIKPLIQDFVKKEKIKSEVQETEEKLFILQKNFHAKILTFGLKNLNHLNVQKLTEQRKLCQDIQQSEHQGELLSTEMSQLAARHQQLTTSFQDEQKTVSDFDKKILELEATLSQHTQGLEPLEILLKLNDNLKLASEKMSTLERSIRSFDQKIREGQTRLDSLKDLLKDMELKYILEQTAFKSDTLSNLFQKLLPQDTELLKIAKTIEVFQVGLKESTQILLPFSEILELQLKRFEAFQHELELVKISTQVKLQEIEKQQDRLRLVELKLEETKKELNRKLRLFDVLGKDDLRTYLLSLVESDLIKHTNQELQKLCQGRYEIIHRSKKMTLAPEFHVLDRFKAGAIRKISTLSGGETFMVSMAMALALADMTRGQAEIDMLFIDEGFGSLDEESLADVMEMLNQMQNRGFLIGLISHIKRLTQSIPVNLVVSKSSQGVSQLTVKFN